jgi:dTDP-4-dehydrorhamnose reductase
MKQDKNIKGYANVYWSGVTTLELAKSISKTIENDLSGLYHVCNGNKISKYELLHLFKKETNKNLIEIERSEEYYSDKSLVKSNKYNFEVPSFEDMIKELFIVINSKQTAY